MSMGLSVQPSIQTCSAKSASILVSTGHNAAREFSSLITLSPYAWFISLIRGDCAPAKQRFAGVAILAPLLLLRPATWLITLFDGPPTHSFIYPDQNCPSSHQLLRSRSTAYHEQLAERRLNLRHHVQKIVALAEIYGTAAIGRALDDAHALGAYSCEYIANLVAQRQRLTPEPGALHLTRASDLLELELPPPDLSPYRANP